MAVAGAEAGGGDGTGRSASGGGDRGSGDDSDDVSTVEKLVMVLSVAFTLALFGVAVWYAVTGPGALAPTVSVVGSQPAPGGGVAYAVEIRNSGDVGLVTATVEAGCTEPSSEVVFEHVPADGRRTGTVVCPPGTNDPEVTVASWVQE